MFKKCVTIFNNVLLTLNIHLVLTVIAVTEGPLGFRSMESTQNDMSGAHYAVYFWLCAILFFLTNVSFYVLGKEFCKRDFEKPKLLPYIVIQSALCIFVFLFPYRTLILSAF